ncbi:hypothetical protein CEXT_115791 [Caerostris extrusa]|uniref:Uncharacterized protein n=1 Tax=Caerostris extrusa TaxID=172846 RepID=A0AAV4VHG8_CAEEX|nr:hypothetical protein CEXT_115791 [Caerostris extrusa]
MNLPPDPYLYYGCRKRCCLKHNGTTFDHCQQAKKFISGLSLPLTPDKVHDAGQRLPLTFNGLGGCFHKIL